MLERMMFEARKSAERPTDSSHAQHWRALGVPQSIFSADSLTVLTASVCKHMHQHLRTRWKSQTVPAIDLHTKTLHAQWQEWIALLLRPEFPARDDKVLKTTTNFPHSPVSPLPSPPLPPPPPHLHPPLKPEVGQNIALHASPKLRIQIYQKVPPLKPEVGQNITLHGFT